MNLCNATLGVFSANALGGQIRLRRLLLLIVFLVLLRPAGQGGEMRTSEARNLAVGIYAGSAPALVGTLRVERVFTEQQRFGFFRVKLMPLLVAQGVRLELDEAQAGTNWTAGFRVKLAPVARSSRIEWRGVSLSFAGESEPRLQARRLQLPDQPATDHCLLEDVTLETDAGLVQASRATLLLGASAGTVVWESSGFLHQWNLFSKTLTTVNLNHRQADDSL